MSANESFQTMQEKLDDFVTSIKLDHVLIFLFFHGFALGFVTTGYVEAIRITDWGLGIILYLMGFVTISISSRFALTVNFIVKSLLIIYVGFALQWQMMAIMSPTIVFKPFITNVMGGAMYVLFVLGSLIFCFMAPND